MEDDESSLLSSVRTPARTVHSECGQFPLSEPYCKVCMALFFFTLAVVPAEPPEVGSSDQLFLPSRRGDDVASFRLVSRRIPRPTSSKPPVLLLLLMAVPSLDDDDNKAGDWNGLDTVRGEPGAEGGEATAASEDSVRM